MVFCGASFILVFCISNIIAPHPPPTPPDPPELLPACLPLEFIFEKKTWGTHDNQSKHTRTNKFNNPRSTDYTRTVKKSNTATMTNKLDIHENKTLMENEHSWNHSWIMWSLSMFHLVTIVMLAICKQRRFILWKRNRRQLRKSSGGCL